MKKQRKRAVIIALAAAVLFTACSGVMNGEAEKDEAAPETEVRDDIVIVTESEPPTLHPFDHKSVTAGYMNALVFDKLFDIDADTLEPTPQLCESWTNDGNTWTFKIFENVLFHDGEHMTAEDVKASMEYAKTFPTTIDYTSFWTDITADDDYTLTVTTDGPCSMTLYNMASIKIVPKKLIDEGHDFAVQPIGSGPYKFVNRVLGDSIEFEANDDYFNAAHRPHIKRMTWKVVPEGSSRTIALEAGEADIIIEVESNDVARLEENADVAVYRVGGTRLNFFAMNNEVYPFNNIDFRRAVNAAIDRQAVITVACNGQGAPNAAHAPDTYRGYSDVGAQGYDAEKAKEYLAASGVDTENLVFSCIVPSDTARRTAEVIQAELAEIGITMEIENMDYATQLSAIMSGDYETSIAGYTSNNLCMFLSGFYHSSAIDAANLARINDGYIDGLIDLSKTQLDDGEREESFRQVIEYINGLCPHAPLYQTEVIRAADAGLSGFKVSASGAVRFEDVYWREN